ncbi:GntR family transcriptional regulator [Leptospira perolatii]|uniref:GntR family transcriptional regulator n=1 Tax=Leptospira perolatii TaxID=2023191 RepID=A0A2M9ZS00_9LEPT|nr:PLP-dependent aminotransferase family protein [Leptospira perolatii]PJZ71326.1 GntR family transcriptional regulator [Leptospira perolatii]PJZ74860.1 GntR family transcriptional regulator [Leptospira perolatii]
MSDTDQFETKYSKIAYYLIKRIEGGEFPVGTKLPSLRRICEKEECNLSTVVEAFGILQERGYISGRERSGFFVLPRVENEVRAKVAKPIRVSKPSLPDEMNSLISELTDPNIISFGAAIPDSNFLPLAALEKSYKEVLKNPLAHNYSDPKGDFELRSKIALRASGKSNRITPEQVYITLGCTEAAYTALAQATRPGDKIAVESPLHFILYQILIDLKLQAIEIPTDPKFGLDIDSYESVLKKDAPKFLVTVPTFSNPTGSLLPVEAKKELIRISAKYGVRIIEDDIYGECSHLPGPRPPSLLSLDQEEVVTQVSSLSKILDPGLRIGWMITDKRNVDAASNRRTTSALSLPNLTQLAAANFLGSLAFERHLREFRRKIGNSILSYADAIREYFPSGTNITLPKGGFLLWVELSPGKDSRDLRYLALKKKISIVPGYLFSLSGKYKECFRINAGISFGPRVKSSIATLGKIASSI